MLVVPLAFGSACEGHSEYFVSHYEAGKPRAWEPELERPIEPKGPGMVIYEVTAHPARQPTLEEKLRARELIRETFRAATRNGWFDFDKAVADGFQTTRLDQIHFSKREYVFDDALLDPERPEFLMYYPTPRGKQLTGVMYYVREPLERGPQIGGPLTVWHYHVWAGGKCFERRVLPLGALDREGKCPEGERLHSSVEMMHVWFVRHPGGPFATEMVLPPGALEELKREDSHDRMARRILGDGVDANAARPIEEGDAQPIGD